ncbi:hypothetical protein L2E82_24633 [Cichorium intybus]|uniref:Uncharacterized protein n=1 Tax=Cichorium intybus TaxID=13427 RepID=A0ACB9E110_CICIN|nr:hypothetical protein L2E82_24633 [Cichorium intybus]
MESLQREIILIEKVCEIYHKISKLDSLKPSEDVDSLFTELVRTCIPPSSINIATLPADVQEIRSKLIRLCGEAEGHLEAHFSAILGSFPNPLQHLNEFPYYSNYLKLSRLEFDILTEHYSASGELKEYDVIYLAALVGVDIDEKVKVIDHLAKYMAPGALLMLRSAHGARVFLYPVVDAQQLQGFEVLSVFHPNDDVINSVVISRKIAEPVTIDDGYNHHHHEWRIDSIMPLSCKYCEFKTFNDPLGQMKMIDN